MCNDFPLGFVLNRIKSPCLRSCLAILLPASLCWWETLGIRIPFFLNTHHIKPEQSNPLTGELPPQTYGLPICKRASFTMLCRRSVITALDSERVAFANLTGCYCCRSWFTEQHPTGKMIMAIIKGKNIATFPAFITIRFSLQICLLKYPFSFDLFCWA